MRKIIAVVGDAKIAEGSDKERLAEETGRLLIENGYRLQSGGLKGVMAAAFRGAKKARNASDGDTVAIIPFFNRNLANCDADIVIATGLDLFRNIIVANADAVIAIGGGAGTLSEIANAWALKRLILAFSCADGWSARLAGKKLDERVRYPEIADDRIYGVASPEEAMKVLSERLGMYRGAYGGIIE